MIKIQEQSSGESFNAIKVFYMLKKWLVININTHHNADAQWTDDWHQLKCPSPSSSAGDLSLEINRFSTPHYT